MDSVLSLRNLTTRFYMEPGIIRAVDGLSYNLAAGRTLAVVGESGCGKTVHALSILRLIPEPPGKIVAGEAVYRGKDILSLPPREMRRIRGNKIAMIFQEPMTSLNPVMKVGEQIAEAIRAHKGVSQAESMNEAGALLERVGIPDANERINHYPHQFSGGMRQRAMIAIALSCKPDILIADEPTTALDVTVQAQILELIRSLQEEMGLAVVLITHNLGIVAETANDIVVMYAGRSAEKGPAGEIFSRPRHPYTKALLKCVPSIHTKKENLEAIPGQPPDLDRRIPGCPFAPRCPNRMPRCDHEQPPEIDGAACWLYE